ncbi:MAG: RNA polymerase factor sigma-54 [Firmicutes bacterium]|nr:RNA polymerase factor sigma-54 [Bacillota bacterium]MBR6584861.1 RNA polymerase factor sigma-54 [Bacillota bacterium]
MRLGYDLTIEQTQKLTMTPELIQAIQILQFNTQELETFVQDELMQNPVLEYDATEGKKDIEVSKTETLEKKESEEADFDLREKVKEAEYDDISYKQWEYSKDHDETSFEQFVSKDETLEDSLLLQLTFSSLRGNDMKIGRFLIEAIDDNGYLTVETEKVAKAFGVCEENVERVLDVIQTFEPSGVGARSLEECLIIQLAAKGLLEDSVEYIILNHMQDLGENKLTKVSKATGLTVEQVQLVADLIRTLEPKPGRRFSSGDTVKYLIPDVIVEKINGEYEVLTNEGTIPHLMVSPYYMNLAKQAPADEELSRYLNDRYNAAMWLIKSIEQRRQTIYNVVSSVISHQKEFLDNGPKYLKTLTLKQVAEDLNIHESTVSRSINGKYMQTPRGVFEIKYFFSSGVTDSTGEGMSSNSIKTFIKEIIDSEDPKKPYSDQDMVEILGSKGIEISRRTVAKYREGMNILSSSKRRRY